MSRPERTLAVLIGLFLFRGSAAAAAPVAYVSSSDSTVSVISAATNTELRKVPIGRDAEAVAISPDGRRAYVADHVVVGPPTRFRRRTRGPRPIP